jgi:hypothetical protein
MKINLKSWVLALGAFAFTLATAPAALASCGGLTLPLPHHSSFQLHDGTVQLMPAALLKDDDDNDNASIAGRCCHSGIGRSLSSSPSGAIRIGPDVREIHSNANLAADPRAGNVFASEQA